MVKLSFISVKLTKALLVLLPLAVLSMAAFSCAALIPMSFHLVEKFETPFSRCFDLNLRLAPDGIHSITIGLWIFSIVAYFF